MTLEPAIAARVKLIRLPDHPRRVHARCFRLAVPRLRPPVEVPPVLPFSFSEWFVASRWDKRLTSAGRHCCEGDCPWRAEIGMVCPEEEPLAEYSWETLIQASSAALPTNSYSSDAVASTACRPGTFVAAE